MNYYPYLNNYSNQYVPQVQNYMQPTQIPQFQQGLNGKIVDSAEVARATEVPVGGYGVFPRADLSEIYVKSWNNNGTTSIITFTPQPMESQDQAPQENVIEKILTKIEALEEKIDKFNAANITYMPTKKVEVNKANEY